MAGEIIILSADGGGGLNYEVVGGTSAPSSPGENTIRVNTSTAITSHVFSSTKPSSPSEGMVWFNIGTSSPAAMNVLEDEDKLYVYPSNCMQYVSDAWVAKTAKTYIGGAWVTWEAYFFNNGDLGVSGGFQLTTAAVSTVSLNVGDTITITSPASASSTIYNSYAHSKEAYNLSGFSVLRVKAKQTQIFATNYDFIVGVSSAQNSSFAASSTNIGSTTEITVDVDISSLSGNYYFACKIQSAGNYANTGTIFSAQLIP